MWRWYWFRVSTKKMWAGAKLQSLWSKFWKMKIFPSKCNGEHLLFWDLPTPLPTSLLGGHLVVFRREGFPSHHSELCFALFFRRLFFFSLFSFLLIIFFFIIQEKEEEDKILKRRDYFLAETFSLPVPGKVVKIYKFYSGILYHSQENFLDSAYLISFLLLIQNVL